MQGDLDGRRRLTRAIRWTARAWAITSIGFIVLLSVGHTPTTARDWGGFLLYPAGVVAGMILAWWREGLGGSITVGSLAGFYALHAATTGQLPAGWWWVIFAAPGFLFLWSWTRSRRRAGTPPGASGHALVGVLALALAGGAVFGNGLASGDVRLAAAPRSAGEACHRIESERFVFHCDLWVNLHHFLFQWARNSSPRASGDRRRAVEVPEREDLEGLERGDRQAWQRAVDFYGEHLVAGDLLFDRRLVELRGRLATVGCAPDGPQDIDPELQAVLMEALRVYRDRWWPRHHAANVAWIQSQAQALRSHEAPLSEGLAAAYGGEWPSDRIRVDVVAYSNWAGGYTTNHPDHVTLSGASYPDLEGLEMIFHEVSHASFFEQRLLGQLAAAFRRHGAEQPPRLAHAIQFATPAELVRARLSAEEREGFLSIGESVAERSPWRGQYAVVLEHWRPFLYGHLERDEALDRIVSALSPADDPE